MRYPSHSELDVRAWKRFSLMGFGLVLDLWIENLLHQQEVLYLHPTTGRTSSDSKPIGASYVFEGTDIADNPLNLGSGRNVRLGLGIDF